MGEKTRTLDELIEMIRDFVHERDWEQYNLPLNLAISTSIEVGELLELFQWKNHSNVEEALKDTTFREALESELADVLIYLLRIADTTGIDPAEAVVKKMIRNRAKYPIDSWEGRAPSKLNRQK